MNGVFYLHLKRIILSNRFSYKRINNILMCVVAKEKWNKSLSDLLKKYLHARKIFPHIHIGK